MIGKGGRFQLVEHGVLESREPGYLRLAAFGSLPVLHAFSTRKGGVSAAPYHTLNLGLGVGDDAVAVRQNRRRYFGALGLDPCQVVRVRQVHGNDVLVVDRELAGNERFPRLLLDDDFFYDALVTDIPGLGLTISTADCLPIFLVDPRRHTVGAVHAGWRSTAKRVAEHALGKMREAYGTDPDDCYAAIGPGIRGCCYEVDEPVIASIRGACRGWQASVEPGGEGRWLLDLAHLNTAILLEAGIRRDRVLDAGLCTACRVDLFYSYRAEKPKTGRMMSLIALV